MYYEWTVWCEVIATTEYMSLMPFFFLLLRLDTGLLSITVTVGGLVGPTVIIIWMFAHLVIPSGVQLPRWAVMDPNMERTITPVVPAWRLLMSLESLPRFGRSVRLVPTRKSKTACTTPPSTLVPTPRATAADLFRRKTLMTA
jgi:hypothetical protein